MKILKLIIFPLLFIFILESCDRTPKYEDVNACFAVSGDIHYINTAVNFVDCSQYAEEYEWNFGDGTISNQKNPSHVYITPGIYQVVLKAYGYNSTNTYTHAVTIQGSTDLDILVMFEGTEDIVSNCEMVLYGNQTDWENLTNPITDPPVLTNSSGIVVFTDLEPVVYFIDAFKDAGPGFYQNIIGETEPLVENTVNVYNVYVRYFTDNNKNNKRISISKIEKSSKEEHERILKKQKSNK